jgi:hypothetical protein
MPAHVPASISDCAIFMPYATPPVMLLASSDRVSEYQLVMGHKDPRSTSIYVQGVAGLIKD